MMLKSLWVSVILFLITALLNPSFAQTGLIKVSGVVKDINGSTLANVSVTRKGMQNGTTTKNNGQFELMAKLNDVLVFSFLGFEIQERVVKSTTSINIVLAEKVNAMDGVVVIGYGSTKRADLTGSVSSVKMSELEKAPVASFDQALAGRVAGVQVSSNEGQPGKEGVNIVIRGSGSLTQSNAPLYVVDGFPMEDFDTGSLNINDIEMINILKDASATAIYGSRGANGVVIIETKRGKAGVPVITYNGSYGLQEVTKTIDLMNPYDFVRYQIDRGNGARYLTEGRTLESYRNVEGVDWQDKLFKTGSTNIHNFSVQGGNAQTKYFVSGSIFNSDAIIINTGYNRYQGRIALDQTINAKIKAGININYSSQRAYGLQASTANLGGGATSYLLFSTWGYRPINSNTNFSTDDSDPFYGYTLWLYQNYG